jgi:hypothetical protein
VIIQIPVSGLSRLSKSDDRDSLTRIVRITRYPTAGAQVKTQKLF